MSTGAECNFTEKEPNQWYYEIQNWPYGEWPEFTEHGPFSSFELAARHCRNHYANPGGHSTFPHPDNPCSHSRVVKRVYADNWNYADCPQCGDILSKEEYVNLRIP